MLEGWSEVAKYAFIEGILLAAAVVLFVAVGFGWPVGLILVMALVALGYATRRLWKVTA